MGCRHWSHLCENLMFPSLLLVSALVVAARPQLQVAAKYALAELTPPKPGDIPAIRAGKSTWAKIEPVAHQIK